MRSNYNLYLLVPPQCPALVKPTIIIIATNKVFFPCRTSKTFSHNTEQVQRDNAHPSIVCQNCWSVRYLRCWTQLRVESYICNDPTIGNYIQYHLSPNGIPSGNQRWYGLVYLVYTELVNLG